MRYQEIQSPTPNGGTLLFVSGYTLGKRLGLLPGSCWTGYRQRVSKSKKGRYGIGFGKGGMPLVGFGKVGIPHRGFIETKRGRTQTNSLCGKVTNMEITYRK